MRGKSAARGAAEPRWCHTAPQGAKPRVPEECDAQPLAASISKTAAAPIPPPMHMLTTP